MMASAEKVMLLVQVLVCLISTAIRVHTAPIIITKNTFKRCQQGVWSGIPAHCCLPKIIEGAGPVVDFCPKHDPSKPLRVRKALQCLTGRELETYKQKLQKGYKLMRALPDDDPRSLKMQSAIHCAYGTGSFLQDGSTNLTIDIHLNWFFLPWHRVFVYFHERILQTLLDDPEFSLHFWNFDNGVERPTNFSSDGCYKAGHLMPRLYTDPSAATFESNRSARAFDFSTPVDLTFDTTTFTPGSRSPRFEKLSFKQAVYLNAQLMHKTMLTDNTTRFIGHAYRAGDARIESIGVGAGSVELYPHSSVHAYIEGIMFLPQVAAFDPIFYPTHANVERLWKQWHTMSENHLDPTDPDWLDATFLLWDENAVLRRIKVRNVLTTEQLGYTYEKVNDASWISVKLKDSFHI